MTNERFDELFGGPARKPEELLTQRHMDLAASIQAVTEEVVLRLTRSARGARPARRTSASPAAWRSTASPTARCCATARSTTSGSSRRRATPAARSARRSPPTTCYKGQPRATSTARDGMAGALSRARLSRRPTSSSGSPRPARSFDVLDDDELIDATAHGAGRRARRSAGSRAAWSSARARSAPARSSAIRARRRCRRS